LTTAPRRATPASRATRRSRRPAPRRTSFLERNRTRLLWGAGAVGFLLLAGIAFINSSQPAYACTNIFDPSPAPSFVPGSQAPAASGQTQAPVTPPPPGYIQPDMGNTHVDPGTRVRYTWCPPASGRHYNASGEGPIAARVYGPSDQALPEGWVHNLEHGALVVLYKCPGPGCTDEGQSALEALWGSLPPSPICNVPPAQLNLVARFDDMAWPFAAVVWDVVLPLQTLDKEAILDFFAQRAERFNPEKLPSCPQATQAPPAATPTPVPSPTPAASPAASPTSTPAAS
jgi:uncharacterized protein DUF3105